jgi:hypothetical protein
MGDATLRVFAEGKAAFVFAETSAPTDFVYDQYSGHRCVTVEPGCTCADHAQALRDRDRLTAENARLQEIIDRHVKCPCVRGGL